LLEEMAGETARRAGRRIHAGRTGKPKVKQLNCEHISANGNDPKIPPIEIFLS